MYTDQQLEVIKHGKGPALVLAAAGSGKSTTIIGRVAFMTKRRGLKPEDILLLTFSSAAQKDLEKKAHAAFPGANLKVSTFHSLGYSIIRKHVRHIKGLRPGVSGCSRTSGDVLSPKALVQDIIADKTRSGAKGMNWNVDIGVLFSSVSLLKRNIIEADWNNIDGIAEFLEDRGFDQFNKLAEFYCHYQERLQLQNTVDFDDMLLYPNLLFAEREDIRKLCATYKAVIVDEAQDSNPVQYNLIQYLTQDHDNLMIVGDDFQSIYSFTGATPKDTILNFPNRYPDGDIYLLESNFRCQENVVKLANGLIESMENPYDKKVVSTKDPGDEVVYNHYTTLEAEAEGVVEQLQELSYDEGYHNWKECAILYRINRQSRLLEDQLIKAKIPYRIIGGTSFYNRKEVRQMMALVEASYHPITANESIRLILNIASNQFGKNTRFLGAVFVKEMNTLAERSYAGSFYMACTSGKLKKFQQKGIDDLVYTLRYIQQGETPAERMDLALEVCLEDHIRREEGVIEDEGSSRLDSISELKKAMVNFDTWEAFAEYVHQVQEMEKAKNKPDFNGVTLMTVHRSKGLEYKNVWVVGMSQGLMPFVFGGGGRKLTDDLSDICNLAEERRIAYVAVTRAIERLYLSSVGFNFKGLPVDASRFLLEMGFTFEKTVDDDETVVYNKESLHQIDREIHLGKIGKGLNPVIQPSELAKACFD